MPTGKKTTHEQFVAWSNEKHNNAYEYLSEYLGSKKKIKIRCKACGNVFEQRADAKQLSKQLNLGCGFDGWTPTFILTPTK